MKKIFLLLLSLGYILPLSVSAYPGCPRWDIIIGGQIWAACNATVKWGSTSDISGWFLSGGKNPVFLSRNWSLSLSPFKKIGNASDFQNGPCAPGYTLPTRGDWETIISAARLNQTSVANLLSLPQNSGWIVQKTKNKTSLIARQNIMGSYWSSTVEDIYGNRPIVFHISSAFGNTRLDSTDPTNTETGYSWQRTDTGLELVPSENTEIANVRCIRP